MRAIAGAVLLVTIACASSVAFAADPAVPGSRPDGRRPLAFCDSCPEPKINVYGIEFRQGQLWTLGRDGTLTRLSGCSPAEIVSVQGFLGDATSLGYDAGRDEFIVADLLQRRIDAVNLDGQVVRSFPTPSTGPIGVTYDATRDVYWVVDSDSDSLYALSATNGAIGAAFKLPTCTLCQGAAYDPGLDAVYYNDPAIIDDGLGHWTTRYYYVSCATGAVIGAAPLRYTGILEWRDNAIAPDGSLWIYNLNLAQLYCMDRQSTPARRATWGQLKLLYR